MLSPESPWANGSQSPLPLALLGARRGELHNGSEGIRSAPHGALPQQQLEALVLANTILLVLVHAQPPPQPLAHPPGLHGGDSAGGVSGTGEYDGGEELRLFTVRNVRPSSFGVRRVPMTAMTASMQWRADLDRHFLRLLPGMIETNADLETGMPSQVEFDWDARPVGESSAADIVAFSGLNQTMAITNAASPAAARHRATPLACWIFAHYTS